MTFHYYPKAVTFGFLTSEDVKKISVVDVRNPESFNQLGHPNTNGLYDPLMGPYDRFQRANCPTCHQQMSHCPGHYGHIDLPLPTYHPLFQRSVMKILKQACPVCRCFLYTANSKAMIIGQLELLHYGLITEAQQLAESIHIDEDYDEEVEPGESKTQKQGERNKVEDIQEKVLQFKEAAGVVEGQRECPPTRSVESIKESLLKSLKERKSCMKCKAGWKKMVLYRSRVVYCLTSKTVSMGVGSLGKEDALIEEEDGAKKNLKSKEKNMYLMANDARNFLRELWKNEKDLFGHLFPVLLKTKGENPTDVFFLDVIPVIPPKFRPVNFVDGVMSENGQSKILGAIIKDVKVVRMALAVHREGKIEALPVEAQRVYTTLQGQSSLAKLQSSLLSLQQNVDMISDSSAKMNKDDVSMKGFRQVIERKEGLFRMNMMGKRVNYAARSVITPDPNLDVEEVGIPEVFAKTLTFPTPVTSWNVYEMRKLVENGPNIYPGANAIEDENGRLIQLNADNRAAREAQAKTLLTPSEMMMQCNQLVATGSSRARRLFKPKIVHRHLHNGDILLINRQPTLHKPSMMAHKARVLKGEKTLRLHYANCKAYNADFDGDEMNAHFPQNQVARSEGYNIVGVAHQYLVPKDGTPLSGLIQDHMIAGVKLTMRGQFFTRADYQQLVFAGLSGRSYGSSTKLLPPTIWKPEPLWSGKQVLSTVILNLTPKGKPLINMNSTAKISVKDWQKKPPRRWLAGGTPLKTDIAMTESEVIFRHGELMCGVLDKMHYGATSYGLIHAFNELYGGQYSCRLLSSFSRVFTTFLQLRGFTLGVRDILVTPEADQKRKEIISRVETIGDGIAARAVGVDPNTTGIDVVRQKLREAHLGASAVKRMTVDHEYKGETDKITNEVNRACIPEGLLRQFPDNNLSLMIQSGAKGSSVNAMQISCLLGQIELEGKRPPLMISGRSLPSFLPYDTSPRAGGFISGRFMTGIRPQEFFFHCMAGREGLIDTAVKTSRSGYLQRCLVKHLEGISVSYDQTVRDSDGSVLQFLYGEDGLDICKSRYLNEKGIPFLVDNRECIRLAENSPSIDLDAAKSVKSASKSVKRWLKKNGTLQKTERNSGFLRFSAQFQDKPEVSKEEIVRQWRDMPQEQQKSYCKKLSPPDPVNGHYPMERHLDVIDEHLTDMLQRYVNSPAAADISEKELLRLIYSKSLTASCHPGEPVGVLAAQSIGEPSTQMTLNTFHFAGRGEMNVTLGIPRLREILMTGSSNIQTPSMDLPLISKGPKGLKKAEKLKLKLTRVTLADVLEKIDVTERLSIREKRDRIYSLKFHFLPRECYKDRFCVKPKDILLYFEAHFINKILLPGLKKEVAAQGMDSLFTVNKAAESRKASPGEEDEDKLLDENGTLPSAETPKDTKKKSIHHRNEDESDDDESEAGDEDDFDAANRREQRADVHEYDEEEDDSSNAGDGEKDLEPGTDDEGFEDASGGVKMEKEAVESEDEKEEEALKEEVNMEEVEQEIMELADKAVEERQTAVLDLDEWIAEYGFDTQKSLYCQLTLSVPLKVKKVDMSSALRRWASSAVVHHVPNIKRAFVVAPKTDKDDVVIKTDGVNIEAMFAYSDILDINRLYSNDVHAISRYYGVEAASRVLVNEIRNVFKVYGIDVDSRHLTLVASYMTSGGGYRAFSRVGMADCTSPLQQMTFETATAFLQKAVLQGKTDYLKSPSSRLVLGLPGVEGTGSFGLLQSLY